MVPALQFILDWHHALIFSYAAFCAILILYVSRGRMSASTSVIFIITSLCVLFVARMPVFAFNIALNPDESQMIANAKKYIFVDMNTWRSVDTGSSGPLNSMVLMWPVLGLGQVTYFSARLTGALLIGVTWLFTYLSLFRSIPQMRIFLAGMLMCFLAGTYFFDFVHYSSEHLPVALLAFSTYIVILALHSRVRRSLLITSALALGAIPFEIAGDAHRGGAWYDACCVDFIFCPRAVEAANRRPRRAGRRRAGAGDGDPRPACCVR